MQRNEALRLAQEKILRLEIELKKKSTLAAQSPQEPAEAEGEASPDTATPSTPDASKKGDSKRNLVFQELMTGKAGEIMARWSVGTLYEDLFKEMTLTPQERQQFLQILVDHQRSEASRQYDERQSGVSQPERERLIQSATDAKIKQLLGKDRLAQYTTYKQQTPDRMKVTLFESMLSTSGSPLKIEQKKQLLAVVIDERKKFESERGSAGLSDTRSAANALDFYQRLANRWGTVLDAEQMIEYNKWKDAMVEYVRFMETGNPKQGAP